MPPTDSQSSHRLLDLGWPLTTGLLLIGLAALARPARPAAAQPSPVAPKDELVLVDQIGGVTYAVDGRDDVVVAGFGPRLRVFRVFDDAAPLLLGQSGVLPGIVQEIALGDKSALVGLREGDVFAMDLRDLSRPQIVGRLVAAGARDATEQGGPTMAIIDHAEHGDLGVVAGHDRLYAFDLADPRQPIPAPPMSMGATVRGIVAEGDELHAAVDIANLRRLSFPAGAASGRVVSEQRLPGTRSSPGTASSVRLLDVRFGRVLYVEQFAFLTISIMDDSGFDNMPTPRSTAIARGVLTEDGLWWALQGADEVEAVRVTAQPLRFASRPPPPPPLPRHGSVHDLRYVGSHLLVAAGARGLLRYRMAPSAPPVLQDHVESELAVAVDVAATPRGAIVATPLGWHSLEPREGLHVTGRGAPTFPVMAVAAGGHRAIAIANSVRPSLTPPRSSQDVARVQFMRTSADASPIPETTIERRREGLAVAVEIYGHQAFVATDGGFLVAFDLRDDSPPQVIDSHGPYASFDDIALSTDLALMAFQGGSSGGIWPLAIAGSRQRNRNAALPLNAAGSPIPQAVALQGRLALFADGTRLQTLEHTAPEVWTPVGAIDLPAVLPSASVPAFGLPSLRGYPRGVLPFGLDISTTQRRAWVAHGHAGIRVVDLRVPAHLDEIFSFDTPGGAFAIEIAGDQVWVADGEAGVLLLRRTLVPSDERCWLPWVGGGEGRSASQRLP